jgi:hypothetical protein
MAFSRTVGLDLPEEFDAKAYDTVNDRVRVIADPNAVGPPWRRSAWFGYAAAWNGLAYRLCSAAQYDAEFGLLIEKGTAPSRPDHYAQERALFGCVTACLSAVECLFMGVYCVAGALAPDHFPLLLPKHLVQAPHDVANAFEAWLPVDPFGNQLTEVAKSVNLKQLADLRNALAHRGVLPRRHFLSNTVQSPSALPSNPKELGDNFDYDAMLSAATTSEHSRWSKRSTSDLVGAFAAFLARSV